MVFSIFDVQFSRRDLKPVAFLAYDLIYYLPVLIPWIVRSKVFNTENYAQFLR